MRDLMIAGGGPVGLVTALHAARAGLDVVVREPRGGPVDKACGEGLMPGAVAALAELGVDPAGRPLAGIRYLDGRAVAQARFRRGEGRGVRRTVLSEAILAAVERAGVTVEQTAVGSVEQRADHVVVDGSPARWLVAADGLHSPLRHRLGLQQVAPAARRFGQRAHVATAPWTPYVEVHWSEVGEAYVTPVAADLVGVAVLSSRRGPLESLLGSFPLLADRLVGHDLGDVRGAGPLRQRSTARSAGRVLLVGDAAGYVDALTGEGLAVGFAQAAAAVDAVVAGDPAGYERAWRQVTRRHDTLTTALLGATRRPVLRRGLVPAAARVPGAFQVAVDQLARPA